MRSKKIHKKQIKKIWSSTFNKSNVEGRNQDKKKKNMAYKLKSNIKELKLKTLCCWLIKFKN